MFPIEVLYGRFSRWVEQFKQDCSNTAGETRLEEIFSRCLRIQRHSTGTCSCTFDFQGDDSVPLKEQALLRSALPSSFASEKEMESWVAAFCRQQGDITTALYLDFEVDAQVEMIFGHGGLAPILCDGLCAMVGYLGVHRRYEMPVLTSPLPGDNMESCVITALSHARLCQSLDGTCSGGQLCYQIKIVLGYLFVNDGAASTPCCGELAALVEREFPSCCIGAAEQDVYTCPHGNSVGEVSANDTCTHVTSKHVTSTHVTATHVTSTHATATHVTTRTESRQSQVP